MHLENKPVLKSQTHFRNMCPWIVLGQCILSRQYYFLHSVTSCFLVARSHYIAGRSRIILPPRRLL